MKKLLLFMCFALIASSCFAITWQEYQSPGVPEKAFSFVYNSSGGQLTKGMVVIKDSAGVKGNTQGMAVTTTTTADDSQVFGVVVTAIDTGNFGLVQVYGYCAVVNLVANDTPYPRTGANRPWVSTGTTAGTCGSIAVDNIGILGNLEGDTPASGATTIPVWIRLH